MAQNYDLVIIGAGPGGYVAAIRAVQLGFSVALVEKENAGGVCLHKGCIPTKSLLRSASIFHYHKTGLEYGVRASDISLDMNLVQARKQQIVEKLHRGVQHLIAKNKIDFYNGHGRILGPSIFSPIPGTVSIEYRDKRESTLLTPRFVMIATGSRPSQLPGFSIDDSTILDSDSALNLQELPRSIIIIGGGVIGVEWASMLSDFGVEVKLIERDKRILFHEDEEISKEMTRSLVSRNIEVITDAKIEGPPEIADNTVGLNYKKDKQSKRLTAEKILVAVGRRANVEDIGLNNTSIKLENGYIKVNQFMQSAESHIYAVGDVVGGYQLAHVASAEGILAVEHMAGEKAVPINPHAIPRAIYSRPEVGSVGLSESEALRQGFKIRTGKFSLSASGKALINNSTDGFIKIISNEENDDLLGVHIIGSHATELITEAALAKFLDATPWELSKSIRAHPTLSEIYSESALAIDGLSIHN